MMPRWIKTASSAQGNASFVCYEIHKTKQLTVTNSDAAGFKQVVH